MCSSHFRISNIGKFFRVLLALIVINCWVFIPYVKLLKLVFIQDFFRKSYLICKIVYFLDKVLSYFWYLWTRLYHIIAIQTKVCLWSYFHSFWPKYYCPYIMDFVYTRCLTVVRQFFGNFSYCSRLRNVRFEYLKVIVFNV